MLVKTSKKHTCIKVANYKRLYSVVEAAEKIMNKWSDDADNEVHIFALPPEKIDTLRVNEDIDEDKVDRQRLPNYICGNIQIQTNRADVDSANPYVDSIKESLSSSKADQPSTNVPDESSDTDEKEKKVTGLLEKIENEKNKVNTWKSTLPIRDQLLEPVNDGSKAVKDLKNTIMDELAGKQPHKAFEKCVNVEMKDIIVTKNKLLFCSKEHKFCFHSNGSWDIKCCSDSNGIPFTTSNTNILGKRGRQLLTNLLWINIQKGMWRHQTVHSFYWKQSIRYKG